MLTNDQKIALVDAMGSRLFRVVPLKVLSSVMGLVSSASLARRVGASIWAFRYHVETGRIPAPSVQLGRRRFYMAADADYIERNWSEGEYRAATWPADTVAEMKRLHASGLSQWDIAERYGTTQSTVSRLIRGRKYNRR